MAQRWYVVQAYSGFEKRVMQMLKERISHSDLREQFGEVLVPTEKVVEMRGGKKREGERRFFPGYVLVQMEMNNETWHLVKSSPKVLGFIGGTSGQPAPITDEEADEILQRVRDGADNPRPDILFHPGEMVHIKEGPFTDFNGMVEDVNVEKSRLRVSVLIFGRSTPVEVEFSQVEKE